MKSIPRIAITPGEPAGIGPDITIQIAQRAFDAELICICDPELLKSRAKQINLPLTIQLLDIKKPPTLHQPGSLLCIPVTLPFDYSPGQANPKNAGYVLECLKIATRLCLDHSLNALVTGPVNKSVINASGVSFIGHTEYLANLCGTNHPVMLFVTNNLRVALATTHLPLSLVSQNMNTHHLMNTIRILHSELQNKFHISSPKITVCGLNPHAGEQGHLGREEIDIIEPALSKLREENIFVIGPLPADTVFTEKNLQTTDAVLAMYHDQALPVVKYMSFGHAVNVTLGLPMIRTSVDHGTAFDIAGTGRTDDGSMFAAIKLAILLGMTS